MTKKEKTLRTLSYSENGETGLDLIRKGCGFDYRKRISELKRLGHNIMVTWERVENMRFKRYKLIK
jgi:hypothetical protein